MRMPVCLSLALQPQFIPNLSWQPLARTYIIPLGGKKNQISMLAIHHQVQLSISTLHHQSNQFSIE